MHQRSELQPGGRKSRSSFVATPDRWETSRSSAASFASSVVAGGSKPSVRKRNAFKAFLRALVSFFSSSSSSSKPQIMSPRPGTTRTRESPYGMLCLLIGQGGFGTVYKATLDDGTPIAVKRAKKSEIKILGQIEHLNLVRLFGYLEENDERVVVTEYVPNGTLREHLDARLDIAADVAHAVTYLHMYAG
ncbi:hypothetical protein BHE74_00009085 [Ensete ventricosum]|nr:hypothetical protein BHE74_00009085 [Ensete ventricosum]